MTLHNSDTAKEMIDNRLTELDNKTALDHAKDSMRENKKFLDRLGEE